MLISLLLVCVWVAIATYADTCFKDARAVQSWRFVIGSACYLSTSFIAILTFGRQQWGWVIIMWNSLSLGLSLLLSVVLYHETFTVRRAVAAVLVATAVLLAE